MRRQVAEQERDRIEQRLLRGVRVGAVQLEGDADVVEDARSKELLGDAGLGGAAVSEEEEGCRKDVRGGVRDGVLRNT